MTYTPVHQMNAARHIARSAQRQIKNKTGMNFTVMLCPIDYAAQTPEQMLDIVAMTLNISTGCYKMKTRTRDVVELRFIAALLLRMHFPRFTLTQIAALFGGQDHSSVLSGIARAHSLIYSGDKGFITKYEEVLKTVNSWLRNEETQYPSAISA